MPTGDIEEEQEDESNVLLEPEGGGYSPPGPAPPKGEKRNSAMPKAVGQMPWQRWLDSHQRVQESKSCALLLGDTAVSPGCPGGYNPIEFTIT